MIDASIPLSVRPMTSPGEIMMNTERMKSMRQARERDAWEMEQAKAEAERAKGARTTLADIILAQTPNMPGAPSGGLAGMVQGNATAQGNRGSLINPPPQGMPGQTIQRPDPWAEYVRYDPKGAVDFRATTNEWKRDQFDMAKELNEGVLQILGGVYDQPSYERAKQAARSLYGRYGVNLDDFQLPEQFSPELVRSLQMEAMNTRYQLDTVRRERQLDWTIEDDQIDNERMAEAEADRARDRAERRAETRRYHDVTDSTRRRGQSMTDSRVRETSSTRTNRSTVRASNDLPVVRTPEEARQLPSGTRFRTPDGQVKVRP